MERMMKVQEVILKAMAGSLKWWIERSYRTWQGRLPQELRSRRTTTVEPWKRCAKSWDTPICAQFKDMSVRDSITLTGR
jgi:seryl-tRNA(Sec) selenium transferase